MGLIDHRLIDRLTPACEATDARPRRPAGPRMRKTADQPIERVYQAPAYKTRRCRCGVCKGCLDNARWERIFAEKFADPTYYSGPVIRHESPLNTV